MKEELWLDSTTGSAIHTSEPLMLRKQYRVTMRGTFSVWPSLATVGSHSGPTEPAPIFPTPGKTNAQVGLDPEFIFAWPPYSSINQGASSEPRRVSPIHVSIDGTHWAHPSCADAYNSDHTYTYVMLGQGYQLQLRFVDRPYDDNYGRIQVVIESESKVDDLTKVEGIGPKTKELLIAGNICTFGELAVTPVAVLDQILDAAGKSFSLLRPATWPEQAALAAADQWDELKALQRELDGGVRT